MNKGYMKFKLLTLSLMIISLFSLPFTASAVSPSSINVDIVPPTPTPGESTTITLSSYGNNLDSALISWFVAGKKVTSSVGMKSFSINAPNMGSETSVKAVIDLPDGPITKTILIRPNIMVLLWQASDSYVPPFYRGKALPTEESTIKVVAMPEVKTKLGPVNPKNMIYSWQLNYASDGESTGYGKNTFTYTNDYLEDFENISATATTIDGQYSSQANINIKPRDPKIVFYKNDASMGILWEQALKDGHKIVGDEVIVASPYFLSPKETWSPNLTWNWFLNDSLTNNTLKYRKNWIPLKVSGTDTGSATLKLQIENKYQLFGNISKEISLEF